MAMTSQDGVLLQFMFKKILIANRGEIACRVIRTAARMGIGTVAVYSDADRNALHVDMADEAINIGPAAAAQSYLVIEKILGAAAESGADAVHPGYGFLSENADFAKSLEKAGVVFIGPGIRAIEVMGDKIASKKFAEKAGVNTVPGHSDIIKDTKEALKVARKIGYPVMMKASAGGGGKGMRIARNDEEVRDGFDAAKSEARSSFGDDRVFIEKFIENPRHIEIQVLADTHGHAIHLCERECSIQRRNQKVIEEAPSVFIDEETRAAMGAQALALAAAVDYHSAGTVEFIVDGNRNFYFLEMNTRLQVEHPVTELITGVDLVEQMIRIAAGEKLALSQQDIAINGWAVEARIYAEDPFRHFLPSTGRLTRYQPPAEGIENGLTLRNDTGVFEGGEIPVYYDPMIAKLIAHGPDRERALDHLADGLDEFVIEGISHNIALLSAFTQHPRFRSGNISTSFIAEEYPDGFGGAPLEGEVRDVLVAVATAIDHRENERKRLISGQMSGRPVSFARRRVVFLGDERQDVEVTAESAALLRISQITKRGRARGEMVTRSNWTPGMAVWRGEVNGRPVAVQMRKIENGARLTYRGAVVDSYVYTRREAELVALMPAREPPDTSRFLLCPMPGLLVSLAVSEGDQVEAGQTLCVVEAMKMENILRAERAATVQSIKAAPGDILAVDGVIMEFD